MKQHQIGGGSAGNAPAKWTNTKSVVARRGMRRPNGTTPNLWRFGGNALAKRNNTKSVAARWGMHRPNGPTSNRWIGSE
jgi:hypothetical protein